MFSHTCWVSQSPHGAPTVQQIAPVSTLPTLIDPPVEGLVEPVSLMSPQPLCECNSTGRSVLQNNYTYCLHCEIVTTEFLWVYKSMFLLGKPSEIRDEPDC